MLPDHVLSTEKVLGYFLPPKDLDPNPLVSIDWGGIALNDPSDGLLYQLWTAELSSGVNFVSTITLSGEFVDPVVILTGPKISEISLTFDQNMNPTFAYMQDGIAKLRWYDSVIEDYTITVFPDGTTAPKCVLDDKHRLASGTSDILVAYTRAGTFYYREQRDRFMVEYTLEGSVVGEVLVVGMSTANRIQFALGNVDKPVLEDILRETTAGDRRVTTQGYNRKVVGGTYG